MLLYYFGTQTLVDYKWLVVNLFFLVLLFYLFRDR